jgi:hypothetical protein
MTRAVCFILMTLAARAQDRPAVQPAMVEGRVISDLDQKPLRRAHVTLRPMDAGLTPGAYLITAEAADSGRRLLGRSAVTVAEDNVENLEQADLARACLERPDPEKPPTVLLEPRSESSATVRLPVPDGKFQCSLVADEIHDVYVLNLPADFYVSAVRANSTDVMSLGPDARLASAERCSTPTEMRGAERAWC